MDWSRYLRLGVYTGLFTIPFIGLIVADWLFFPFITGKNFAFRIIIELVFAMWLALAIWKPEYRPRKSLALILGGVFVLAIAVSDILSPNPIKSFWSNFERMEGWVTLVHLGMYITVLTAVLRTEEWWQRFLTTSIGASMLVSLYGILQLLGFFTINQGGVRVDGTFGNATYLAVYMLIHAFLAILGFFRWSNGNRQWQTFYAVAFVMDVLMIFYSATRGSILGFVGGLFLAGLIVTLSPGAQPRMKKLGIGVLIALVVVAGGFFAIKNTSFVQNNEILSRIASISLSEGSTRFQIWHMALEGAAARPIFGWGQESFNYLFNQYYRADLYAQEPWFDRAHDVYLDWLVAGGIIGLALYVSLYLVLLYYLWRPGNTFDTVERAVLTGLLAGYAFHNVFVFDNLMSYLMFAAIFAYITVRALPPTPWGTPTSEGNMRIAAPIIGIGLIVFLYFVNVPGYTAASDLIKGLQAHPEGLTANVNYFKDAVAASQNGLGSQEVHEQLLQFATQVKQLNAGDAAFQSQVATYARDEFLKELAKTQNDAREQVFIGSYLRQFGDATGAAEHLNEALKLSPQKQSIMFELGTLKSSTGDAAGAEAVFKQAFELAPAYDQARDLYAASAILAGDQGTAEKLLMDRYGTDTPDSDYLVDAYMRVKQYSKAEAIVLARTAKNPKNTQAWTLLAGIYIQEGNTAKAIEALEKAIAADPSFKDQGQQYIEGIQNGTIKAQ